MKELCHFSFTRRCMHVLWHLFFTYICVYHTSRIRGTNIIALWCWINKFDDDGGGIWRRHTGGKKSIWVNELNDHKLEFTLPCINKHTVFWFIQTRHWFMLWGNVCTKHFDFRVIPAELNERVLCKRMARIRIAFKNTLNMKLKYNQTQKSCCRSESNRTRAHN